jgi:hypothetical protein
MLCSFECHCAECHMLSVALSFFECHSAERRYADCNYAEYDNDNENDIIWLIVIMSRCHSVQCHYDERRQAEC